MFRPLALLIALAAAPALVAASPTGSVDDTRIHSLIDTTRDASPQAGRGADVGLPTYGANAGSGQTGVSGGTVSTAEGALAYYTVRQDFGSGFIEEYLVSEPFPRPTTPVPMVVAFHAFGVSQKDILVNTQLLQECAKRRWYLLAPLSANGSHFMSDPGQSNTQSAVDWTLAAFNVDSNRIYGVGFSMGGGMALNYAARHLSPTRGMFAALVDHTGAVDLNETYQKDPASRFVFDFWYGDGSAGSADPYKMSLASMFEYDQLTQQIDPETEIARNLEHIPIYMVRAENDPLVDLAVQHDRLYTLLAGQGRTPGPAFTSKIVPSSVHKWYTMDMTAACDWLSQFSLQMPSSGRTLALKEGTYFDFYVDQAVVGQRTPFTWSVDQVANRLEIKETSNLSGLYFDSLAGGLDTSEVVYVRLSTSDGDADVLGLRGYDVAPAGVMRDGKVLDNTWWSYVPSAKMVVLNETDGTMQHNWLVAPGS